MSEEESVISEQDHSEEAEVPEIKDVDLSAKMAKEGDHKNRKHQASHKSTANLKVNALTEEINALKEEVLKRRAEFENFRKRMERDKQDFAKYALENFVKQLLPVLDSFNSALSVECSDEASKKIYLGFEMIFNELNDFLAKNEIHEIKVGEDVMFDPAFHEAITQQKIEGKKKGEILKEYRKGYVLRDRVIRPSMVVVAE